MTQQNSGPKSFHLLEATIDELQRAIRAREVSARELVQLYLNRIHAYDGEDGPNINSIISINPKALEEADKLDAALSTTGSVGPLHGVPVILKDQIDAVGMPTTLGSVLLKDYYPDRDAFIVEKLKKAGAIMLAKATLGELGGGDTYGTLFGFTRNPYGLDRTVGGSSGGPAASVSANFAAVAVGQEGFASIRRPSGWNCIVGMRPTPGLVSRSGSTGGWPNTIGSLGPMCRTVEDLATLLDVLVGYDPDDPITALGVGQTPIPYTSFLDKRGLERARIGIIREAMGYQSEPDSEDFKKVSSVFDSAVAELEKAGAKVVDPIVIPQMKELLAKRSSSGGGDADEGWNVYAGRSKHYPFKSRQEMLATPGYTPRRSGNVLTANTNYYEYLLAREKLMFNVFRVMADHELDAIVHKTVEHQPNLISEGLNPPYTNLKGAPHINTFLGYVASLSVPCGFTTDNLPVGISFFGRPYSEGTMIKLAYAYEQVTMHRRPPSTTPPLPGEP